jgi:hypothetical protein
LWGVVSLFVAVSIWGIVTLIYKLFGIDAASTLSAPELPHFK